MSIFLKIFKILAKFSEKVRRRTPYVRSRTPDKNFEVRRRTPDKNFEF